MLALFSIGANPVDRRKVFPLRSPPPSGSTLFPYTTLFRSLGAAPRRPPDRHPFAQRVKPAKMDRIVRSEEHTSELQSPDHLVCRLLREKKKTAEIADGLAAANPRVRVEHHQVHRG